MRKLLAPLAALALLVMTAGVAAAHDGDVTGSQDCDTWTVTVTLNHNVTIDRKVIVETTIPGTTGITDGHYDSTFGVIWTQTGAAPVTGTVTLIIKNGSQVEFTDSKTITPKEDCVPPSVEQSVPPSVEQSVAASVEQSVPASAEQSVEAGTGTPNPSTPNTSTFGDDSSPLPTAIFSMVLLASLATLAYTNVRVARAPRRNR